MKYQQLIVKDLQDLYQAESENARQLREFAGRASHPDLRAAIEDHATETQQQVVRIGEILGVFGESPGGQGEVPQGLRGLIAGAHKRVEQMQDPALRDLAIIAELQKIEHFEIACYGTARAMARTAGMQAAARLLQTTLDEEEAADRRFTEIALPIHKEAAQAEPELVR